MSFKREGDDWSQLNVLKRRRVGDLLASYIPEDEALMLRDGRFACAVCPHRPVLDTLAMLTAHRAGKKHLSSLQLSYGRRRPARGRGQRPGREPSPRRPSARGGEEAAAEAPLLAQTRLITQHALHRAPHYSSCCRRRPRKLLESTGSPGRASPSLFSLNKLELSALPRPDATRPSASHSPLPPPEVELQREKMSRDPGPEAGTPAKESAAVKSQDLPPVPVPLSPTRKRAMDHYLKLRSSGWIPDGQGHWVKDENVEFDSDEEEPPGLPLG